MSVSTLCSHRHMLFWPIWVRSQTTLINSVLSKGCNFSMWLQKSLEGITDLTKYQRCSQIIYLLKIGLIHTTLNFCRKLDNVFGRKTLNMLLGIAKLVNGWLLQHLGISNLSFITKDLFFFSMQSLLSVLQRISAKPFIIKALRMDLAAYHLVAWNGTLDSTA